VFWNVAPLSRMANKVILSNKLQLQSRSPLKSLRIMNLQMIKEKMANQRVSVKPQIYKNPNHMKKWSKAYGELMIWKAKVSWEDL
jgi:hypothetical protein